MAKWAGYGCNAGNPDGTWSEYIPIASSVNSKFVGLANKWGRVRIIEQRAFTSSMTAQRLWALDIKAYNPNIFILFGVSNGGGQAIYLPTFYDTYLPILQATALWAQNNAMDALQIANEFEISAQGASISITSLNRLSNVTTCVTTVVHGLTTGDTVNISGATPSSFNGTDQVVTVIDTTTFTYANAGTDGAGAGTPVLKAGEATIVRFVKLLAAAAQLIFTRGDIIYSCSQGHESYWITAGKGTDLDKIAFNFYGVSSSFSDWKSRVDSVIAAFGTANCMLTEFNVNSGWATTTAKGATPDKIGVGFDIAYADENYKRMAYLESTGIDSAYFYSAYNASSEAVNQFTQYYSINTPNGRLDGHPKSVFNRLNKERVEYVFYGSQLT